MGQGARTFYKRINTHTHKYTQIHKHTHTLMYVYSACKRETDRSISSVCQASLIVMNSSVKSTVVSSVGGQGKALIPAGSSPPIFS